MNSEDVIVYFTALVAIGIIVVGLLTTALHSYLIAPIVIIGIVLAAFVLLSKGNFAHKIESIEKICFVITFLAIICSFYQVQCSICYCFNCRMGFRILFRQCYFISNRFSPCRFCNG